MFFARLYHRDATSEYHFIAFSISVDRDDAGVGFVMKPWDTTAVLGSTVTLFCAVNRTDSSDRLATVTWLKKGSTLNTRY